jgi:hypothetical protein
MTHVQLNLRSVGNILNSMQQDQLLTYLLLYSELLHSVAFVRGLLFPLGVRSSCGYGNKSRNLEN